MSPKTEPHRVDGPAGALQCAIDRPATVPRTASGGSSIAHSMAPAGPAIDSRRVSGFIGDQRPTVGASRRRSTGWPFFRWDSTISSISVLSTKVYQVSSG